MSDSNSLILMCVAEVREMFGEPDYPIQLERLVMKVPNAKEVLAKRRKLFGRWSKVWQHEKAGEVPNTAFKVGVLIQPQLEMSR